MVDVCKDYILVCTLVSYIAFRLRRFIAKLSDDQLETFLLSQVLIFGVSKLLPILILLFEGLACLRVNTSNPGHCKQAVTIELFLAGYLSLYMVVRLLIKAVPQYLTAGKTLSFGKLVSLDLENGQFVQLLGGVGQFVARCFFYVVAKKTTTKPDLLKQQLQHTKKNYTSKFLLLVVLGVSLLLLLGFIHFLLLLERFGGIGKKIPNNMSMENGVRVAISKKKVTKINKMNHHLLRKYIHSSFWSLLWVVGLYLPFL